MHEKINLQSSVHHSDRHPLGKRSPVQKYNHGNASSVLWEMHYQISLSNLLLKFHTKCNMVIIHNKNNIKKY